MNVKFVAAFFVKFFVKERFMNKNNKTGQRIYRQQTPTNMTVGRYCVGTEKWKSHSNR